MKKKQILIIMAMIIAFATLSVPNTYAQDELEGRLIGIVKANNGKTIYLTERQNYGLYSVAAFTKSKGKYVEEKAFKVKGSYQSVINSVRYDLWNTSNPKGEFFCYDKSDKTLYVPLINENLQGSDHYIVYKFDGEHFVHKGTGVGYWLHSSLHSFDSFVILGRTKNHIVRIDRMDDGSYRYAAWSSKQSMSDKPSIILPDGSSTRFGEGYQFTNGDYLYVVNEYDLELRVYKNGSLIKCEDMEILF